MLTWSKVNNFLAAVIARGLFGPCAIRTLLRLFILNLKLLLKTH